MRPLALAAAAAADLDMGVGFATVTDGEAIDKADGKTTGVDGGAGGGPELVDGVRRAESRLADGVARIAAAGAPNGR